MSDLRESILQAIPLRSPTYHRIADAVLSAITAHMAVTEEDAIEMWNALDRAHGIPENDAMKAALEAFVARKLEAETT